MNEVIKSQNDVTVFADGSAFISQRKAAKLCGVDEKSVRNFLKSAPKIKENDLNINGLSLKNEKKSAPISHLNTSKSNQLDHKNLVLLVTYYATKNRAEAIRTLSLFAEAGAKAFLYHEAGYEFKATRRDDIAEQLKEAQRKLAYCSIHADSLKATFELRDNTKVNAIKESWVELGYLSKRTVMKQVTEYGITPEGSEHLYYNNKQIRIKPESKHGLKLITHGFNIGRFGQSELFIV